MIINPFVSVDQQLSEAKWVKMHENSNGFTFVKPLGSGYFIKADCEHGKIKFFDPLVDRDNAKEIDEIELKLFAAKIKEWRRQYECSNKGGRHYSEKQS